MKWASLAGALALTGVTTPARVIAQDQDTIVRAFDVLGRGTQIGASVTEVSADDARQAKSGVLVETVTPGGPADKAGVKAGDTITEFDGERVRSVRQFSRLVQESAGGRAVSAAVTRGGQRVTVTITPESRGFDELTTRFRAMPTPAAPRAPRPPAMIAPNGDFPSIYRLWNTRGVGVTIESLDDQLAEYFGVKEGVLVKSVVNDSPAQKAGLKAGDVITAIDGRKIYETSDVNRAIDRVAENGEFTVEVMRDKKAMTLKGKLEASEARRTRVRTVL